MVTLACTCGGGSVACTCVLAAPLQRSSRACSTWPRTTTCASPVTRHPSPVTRHPSPVIRHTAQTLPPQTQLHSAPAPHAACRTSPCSAAAQSNALHTPHTRALWLTCAKLLQCCSSACSRCRRTPSAAVHRSGGNLTDPLIPFFSATLALSSTSSCCSHSDSSSADSMATVTCHSSVTCHIIALPAVQRQRSCTSQLQQERHLMRTFGFKFRGRVRTRRCSR